MRQLQWGWWLGVMLGWLACAGGAASGQEKENPVVAESRKSAEAAVKAFNAGQADDLAAAFLPDGEFIDEAGTIYQGRKELTAAFTKFFEKFPGAKLTLSIESVRAVGPSLVIEEGTRVVVGGRDEDGQARVRYVAVRTKSDDGKWLIASHREFNDDPPPTPHERLKSLEWLVGDWVNEGSDAKVKIKFSWSDDKNYLLGNYEVVAGGKEVMKSSQRLAWDPVQGRVRSWLFDADGSFSEGNWTPTDDGWIVKSNATNAEGSTGSATLTYTRDGEHRFKIEATHRYIGDQLEPDFEIVVTRQPPSASKR